MRRELWNFGEPGDMFYDALLKANHLRYELIPYIYTMAARVWRDDYTMYRMLAFDFVEDEVARDIQDQFIFGESLMVCPVIEPMYYESNSKPIEKGTKSRQVYLPKGTDWYDFWSNQYYTGGQSIMAEAPIDRIPLYVKAGSIIPMAQFMNYVDERSDEVFKIQIYSGEDAEFELYKDAGDNYRYERGEYEVTKFLWSEKEQILKKYNVAGDLVEIKGEEYQVNIFSK